MKAIVQINHSKKPSLRLKWIPSKPVLVELTPNLSTYCLCNHKNKHLPWRNINTILMSERDFEILMIKED